MNIFCLFRKKPNWFNSRFFVKISFDFFCCKNLSHKFYQEKNSKFILHWNLEFIFLFNSRCLWQFSFWSNLKGVGQESFPKNSFRNMEKKIMEILLQLEKKSFARKNFWWGFSSFFFRKEPLEDWSVWFQVKTYLLN